MNHTSRHTETKPDAPIPADTIGADHILAHLGEAWPDSLPQRDIANLPRPVFDALRGGRPVNALARAIDNLDRTLPGWPELAAAALAHPASHSVGQELAPATLSFHPSLQRLAALLARRPLRDPDPLLRAVASTPDPEARLWVLTALSGTDTPAVRAAWLDYLRRTVQARAPRPDRALWFAFLHAFLRGWLTYPDFRDCLTAANILSAAHKTGDYRRAISRLGLSSHPTFGKWHRQVVYEVAHQPDVSLSVRAGGWIRDFPGEDYLLDALSRLEQNPDSWWPLHVLRWTSGIDPNADDLAGQLRAFSPVTLCLLSLIRPDLSPAAERALAAPGHEESVRWLRTTGPSAALDLDWIEATFAPWTAAVSDSIVVAVGALCSLDPPADFTGPADPVLRRRTFLRAHILPDMDRVVDNLCYLHALRKRHFDIISQQAAKGLPAAIRSLALWTEKAEQSAPILFRLARKGTTLARRAALETLHIFKVRSGISDLQHLERRVDLASAWADAGLEGRPARIWWDLAGYRIKLSVASGRVALRAYSDSRPLAGLPKAVTQHPGYAEVRDARAHLARGYRYFRRRFEEAMVEGVCYSGRDFAVILGNPMVRSLVSRLILLVDGAPLHWTPSDPLDDCRPPGDIGRAEKVAIAHPLDLSGPRTLPDWQQRVIESRIPQPFKQAFREVYLPGADERAATSCPRFSGQPVIARRAFALLRTRGYAPKRGDALKEWPAHRLCAHIQWAAPHEDAGRLLAQSGPADPVTSGAVRFETDGGEPVPLADVPRVVFSETLRDADLLVSRAAAGELGFTSRETRRLRATIIRYLARALGLTNIYTGDNDLHVIVEGERAMYRVHLGSGSVLLENSRRHLDLRSVVNKQLEGLVAESMDSLTARIVGIVGSLSRDDQIADLSFLQQLAADGGPTEEPS